MGAKPKTRCKSIAHGNRRAGVFRYGRQSIALRGGKLYKSERYTAKLKKRLRCARRQAFLHAQRLRPHPHRTCFFQQYQVEISQGGCVHHNPTTRQKHSLNSRKNG